MAQVEILYAQTAEVSGPETSVDRRRQHTPVPKALARFGEREQLILGQLEALLAHDQALAHVGEQSSVTQPRCAA